MIVESRGAYSMEALDALPCGRRNDLVTCALAYRRAQAEAMSGADLSGFLEHA